ncbi:MAG: TadE family protein [Ilumatobacter sp.]
MPFIIIGMLLVVQFGIGLYARQVVQGAAQDGADTAARSGSSIGDGLATTDSLVGLAGGHLITGFSSSGESSGDVVTISAEADVVRLLPLFPVITIRATGSASVEQFVPAGS